MSQIKLILFKLYCMHSDFIYLLKILCHILDGIRWYHMKLDQTVSYHNQFYPLSDGKSVWTVALYTIQLHLYLLHCFSSCSPTGYSINSFNSKWICLINYYTCISCKRARYIIIVSFLLLRPNHLRAAVIQGSFKMVKNKVTYTHTPWSQN